MKMMILKNDTEGKSQHKDVEMIMLALGKFSQIDHAVKICLWNFGFIYDCLENMTLYKWWGKNNDTCQIYEQ